jgi:hypothetical protein
MPQDPDKPSLKGPLLFGSHTKEVSDSLTSRLRSEGCDSTIASDLTEVGGRILESDSDDFVSWRERMVSELGESVRPHLSKIWRDLPARGCRIWEESVSEVLTQKERVLLLFARKNFGEKWKKAEDGRREQKPSQYEQRLMTLAARGGSN